MGKYLLAGLPFAICLALASIYAFIAATGRQAAVFSWEGVRAFELTSIGSENIAVIFVFAGYVFSQMAWIYCLYVDWLAWDDRRQLQRVLDEEEKAK